MLALVLPFLMLNLFIALFEKQRREMETGKDTGSEERRQEGEKEINLRCTGPLFKCLQKPGLSQAKVETGIASRLPTWVAGTHVLLPSSVVLSGALAGSLIERGGEAVTMV